MGEDLTKDGVGDEAHDEFEDNEHYWCEDGDYNYDDKIKDSELDWTEEGIMIMMIRFLNVH